MPPTEPDRVDVEAVAHCHSLTYFGDSIASADEKEDLCDKMEDSIKTAGLGQTCVTGLAPCELTLLYFFTCEAKLPPSYRYQDLKS